MYSFASHLVIGNVNTAKPQSVIRKIYLTILKDLKETPTEQIYSMSLLILFEDAGCLDVLLMQLLYILYFKSTDPELVCKSPSSELGMRSGSLGS